ncbi:U4/U6.U5 tri-snRNP-associated protein 1 isoform X2 [Hyposmocoma kahamanoa]|uniref:U4/U6.U5 tri-snRNP-associated protein 1 isoform X2 n=1 Tax=Hyposmocoma kahamanoa TaxID=1477025 RepID=UPI000E6DA51A|nr:U4/U6.U5 tri-snRNP-associated protein 1 isoform X2 [Hyposmocoma kahamanoa]
MGSKKHKKESKKKKHRSRSRSPLDGEERERKRHKKHKDRKKDRSPDVEEVPVDSHLQKPEGSNGAHSHSRSTSVDLERERDRRLREERRHREDNHEHERPREREASPVASSSGAVQESLSIEETNRLRAKLGLKPLEVTEKPPEDDGKLKDDLGEFYHKPAANLAAQRRGEKLRERLDERREKRSIEHKLQTTLLAEGSDDEDADAWVKKSREMEKQKRDAAKRAAMLDEMDAVFGVSALLAEEQRQARAGAYEPGALRGLRVAHDLDAIGDERETVLTLADEHVLADDAEDVLVNVNLLDDERYKKNLEERKKAIAGYQAYDDEAELEAAALGSHKPVLAKYDDEIDKHKKDKSRGFVIGDTEAIEAKRIRDMMRQERLQGGVNKRLESLRTPDLQIAQEYLNEHEIRAQFKKPKRKGKMRKKPKDEPIDVDAYEAGGGPLLTDDTEVKPDALRTELAVDDEEVEPDSELQIALARARRLRQAERRAAFRVPKVEELLEAAAEAPPREEPEGAMVLDATAEFCRTLGDIPTYGLAGNREHRAEILDAEPEAGAAEAAEGAGDAGDAGAAGAWSRVDVRRERPAAPAASAGLDAEPRLGAGVAGALQLALSKGYLERAGAAPAPRSAHLHLLAAKHYSIEDKTYGEDDKYGRRERGGHSGPLQDFREKANFRPDIKLEYVDDDGRPLCPKEAFRYLSHKFHGKGPGKNKQEKRIKKAVQEGLMKKMSSTDTPLGTLQMLQDKQRETHSAYIVLSGQKRDHAA